MQIITLSAIKGGVGKTTLAYNFGEWLAQQGKHILFIDLDHQSNLTQTYSIYDTEKTVANIFMEHNDKDRGLIHTINDHISIIPGDMHLDDVVRDLENKTNKNMLLYLWLYDNYHDMGLDKIDYIIIDTHPDFGTATKNAVIISDAILSPITPSEHGYNAKFNLTERVNELRKEAIDFTSRQSYVTAKLWFIANMVRHNTRSSHELEQAIANDGQVIATVPEKELFNRTTLDRQPLSKLQNDRGVYLRNRLFFEQMEKTFATIAHRIETKGE